MPPGSRTKITALHPDRLRWRCDPGELPGPSTASVPPDETWIGDERTRATVELALRAWSASHHLILRGAAGTGMGALLRQCLAAAARQPRPLLDHLYVRRFDEPRRPRLISLPAGNGRRLLNALDNFARAMNVLRGTTRRDGRKAVRVQVARVRDLKLGRAVRQHLGQLREQALRDIPVLTSEDDLDDDERVACTERYRAHLVRDTRRWSPDDGAGFPVVWSPTADHRALLGSVDAPAGEAPLGLAQLAGGALLEADGGVCVIAAGELLADAAVVRRLLATLSGERLELIAVPGNASPEMADYQPDPIPINVRVVVTAARTARLGPLFDHAARRVFGLLADGKSNMAYGPATGAAIAGFVAHHCRAEGMIHVRADGLARLIEEQVRDVDGKGRISARLGLLRDRVMEADLVARDRGHRTITAGDVATALQNRRWRIDRGEQRHRERLVKHRLHIDTEGAEIGTVNGLLVYTLEGLRYGAPTRITATTAVGREGVINIEREAKLSGKTFDKGVYLLVGLLRHRFGQTDPLGLVAMITCEQNYGMIDGDSAAAAELAAILSDLAAAPVRQGFALTGSLSQRGELLPVGGINEKIEGFFATCRDRRLTGGQGVIIPRANVEDLVLGSQVVEAARAGRFRIAPVDTIEQAMEILTGIRAGARGEDGRYPPRTVLGRAQKRLREMSRRLYPPRKSGKKAAKPTPADPS